MSFWRSEELQSILPGRIFPYRPKRIKHGAYELSLGSQAFRTCDTRLSLVDKNLTLSIPPGQFAMLLTEERVVIPDDCIPLISIKAGVKFRGLVNVSGFHVDPGFKGKLLFSVYNAGAQTIFLQQGEPLFPIWFCTFTEATADTYKGRHQNREYISADEISLIHGKLANGPHGVHVGKTPYEALRSILK